MKIFKVTLENYRQYYGKVCLDFATGDHNITIIQGDNGGGKSNLMNAIVWCLFNDEMFKSKSNEGRPVVNENALSNTEIGNHIDVSVSVVIGNDEPEYEFVRSITFSKDATGRPVEIKSNFDGYQITLAGLSKLGDPDWIINRDFIPYDLRSFFFFDGEKMDQYFEDTSSVKTNVERISQIDALDNIIRNMNSTIRVITRQMTVFSPKSKELSDRLVDLEDEKNHKESELVELNYQKTDLIDEIRGIDEFLKNNSSEIVRLKSNRRSELTQLCDDTSEQITSLQNEIKHIISDAIPSVYAYRALENAANLIDEETNKGTLPPNIKDLFLKELLERGVCICGRPLDDESSRKNIQDLLDRVVPSDIANEATQGKYTIRNILSKTDFRPTLKSIMQKQVELELKLQTYRDELDSISDELSRFDVSEIADNENRRKTLETKLIGISSKIIVLNGEISNIKKDMEETQTQLDEANRDHEKCLRFERQRSCAEQLRDLFKEVRDKIIKEVRIRLETKTREYFFNMIWKKDAFSDVRIIDTGRRYRISVLSPNNAECLGDLSAGERQVLALSFTAALYSVSGYSVPVIIDTPLGRISGTTRENIASALPNYLSETQLIMTMTDTEYTDSVRNSMKSAVGREYKIVYNEKTKTSEVIEL